jgi:cell wall-associated NlpC family hydrolase
MDRYTGIPYANKGRWPGPLDCWGLAQYVLRDAFRIYIPSYADRYQDSEGDDAAAALALGKETEPWLQVDDPRPGDLVEIAIAGKPWHVGVYIGEGQMLHTRDGVGSCIEDVWSPTWRRRVRGFWRYACT